MTRIAHLHAREVLDSRGQPTIEVELRCANGSGGRAIVPSGASTGKFEAHELRDGDPERYDGRGVRRAIAHIHETIAPRLLGRDPAQQEAIDAELLALDPTPQKTQLGGNALLGVSLAAAHAAAAAQGCELYEHLSQLWQASAGEARQPAPPTLPLPMTNMISGGLHAGGNLDFQDVLIQPVGAPDYPTALEWIVRVYRRLGKLLGDAGYEGRLVGDEGGFGPRLQSNRQAIEFVVQAIEHAGLVPGSQVNLALDVAATHFFADGRYRLASTGGAVLSAAQLIDQLAELVDAFPIASIEDPLAEDDWEGWQAITRRLSDRVRLVGDDLFTTNATRLQRGIELQAANAVLIKVNQIGTLTETFATMRLANRAGYQCVVSARSGETEDSTIADLAVATGAARIKIGSIVRSERLAKYNRLLRIAERVATPAWR
ncbi:MAG: phosphopyruvate hydratase [Planctomycetaceae bacterium]|nr:phosphopyruvate hydratase [Planctomycetaceae bacterium]